MSTDGSTDDAAGDTLAAEDSDAVPSTRPRPSPGPLIALGLALVVVIAAVVVAIVGGDEVSATAVRVNSTEVSQKTFNHQLRELAPVLRAQGESASAFTDAFVPSGTAAQLAQVYVGVELLRGRVDVNESDRRTLLAEGAESLAQYDPDIRGLLVELTLLQNALVAERGDDGAARFLGRLARDADIHVDPRYGFWNPALAQVCPPTGCTAAAPSG